MATEAGSGKTDWSRILRLLIAVAISVFVGHRFHPMIVDNSDAVNTVVTIFSILAGFLIAVITLLINPTLSQAKDWRELQLMKKTVEQQLLRQKLLFFLYLLTLGLALAMFLTPDSMTEMLRWLQMIFLSLATFVFLASFALPGSLIKIQMERYEAALDEKKPTVVKNAEMKSKMQGKE